MSYEAENLVSTLPITQEQLAGSVANLLAYIKRCRNISEGCNVEIIEKNPGRRANGERSEPFVRYRVLVPAQPQKKQGLF